MGSDFYLSPPTSEPVPIYEHVKLLEAERKAFLGANIELQKKLGKMRDELQRYKTTLQTLGEARGERIAVPAEPDELLTIGERKMLAYFLDLYSDECGNAGCNDLFFPDTMSETEKKELVASVVEWFGEDAMQWPSDFMVVDFLKEMIEDGL